MTRHPRPNKSSKNRSFTRNARVSANDTLPQFEPLVQSAPTSHIDAEIEEEHVNLSDDSMFFHLKTESGEFKYKPTDCSNHTDFLRAIIELTIAFNSPSVDPKFKNIIQKALRAYESGESNFDDSEDFGDEYGENGYVLAAIEQAQQEALKMDEAGKFVSNLPDVAELKLQILSTKEDNVALIDKIISKNTDLNPSMVFDAIKKHVPFTLPATKAKELYIQLRMLDVALTIKPLLVATKKSSAAKKTSSSTKRNAKSRRLGKESVTGEEKLTQADGIITDES